MLWLDDNPRLVDIAFDKVFILPDDIPFDTIREIALDIDSDDNVVLTRLGENLRLEIRVLETAKRMALLDTMSLAPEDSA